MEKAVPVLLIEHLEPIRRFARKLTCSNADADDLVQDACERILSRAHQYRPETIFKSWAFRIVQTIWIDEIREREVRNGTTSIEAVPEMRLGSNKPQQQTEARIELGETSAAAQQLSPEHRTVLHLVAFEGLSYKETAEIMGTPVGTVMSRLSRAREGLHTVLGEAHAA